MSVVDVQSSTLSPADWWLVRRTIRPSRRIARDIFDSDIVSLQYDLLDAAVSRWPRHWPGPYTISGLGPSAAGPG